MNHRQHSFLRNLLAIVAIHVAACSTVRAQFTTVINVPPDAAPSEIGSDTQLNLADGGALGAFFSVGSFEVVSANAELNVTGGGTGRINVFAGARANVSGGLLGDGIVVNDGGFAEFSGGRFSDPSASPGSPSVFAQGDSVTKISGGVLSGGFEIRSGGIATISGGVFGGTFATSPPFVHANPDLNRPAAAVTLIGGDFRLNGQPIAGLDQPGAELQFNAAEADVLSGVFADGAPFAFSSLNDGSSFPRNDLIGDGSLTLRVSNLPEATAQTINAAADLVPLRTYPRTPARFSVK